MTQAGSRADPASYGCQSRSDGRHTLRHTRGMADLGYDADFLDAALAPPAARDDEPDTDPVRPRPT